MNLQPSHLQSDVLSTELLRPVVKKMFKKKNKKKFRIKPKILQVQFLGWIYIAVNILYSTGTHSSVVAVVVQTKWMQDAGSNFFSTQKRRLGFAALYIVTLCVTSITNIYSLVEPIQALKMKGSKYIEMLNFTMLFL